MKKLQKIISALVIGLVITTSCKKEEKKETNTNQQTTPSMSFSCKINGTAYSGTSSASFNTGGFLVISLPFADATVALNTTEAMGTYNCSGLNLGYVNMSSKLYNTSFTGGSGTITISTLSTTEVGGTFNFKAKTQDGTDSVSVTEGVFSKIPHV